MGQAPPTRGTFWSLCRGSIPRWVETSTVWLNLVVLKAFSILTASARGTGLVDFDLLAQGAITLRVLGQTDAPFARTGCRLFCCLRLPAGGRTWANRF